MDQCNDKRLGSRLYAYELDLLNDEEREEFEIHLLECKYCNERARKFSTATEIIKNDQIIKDRVAQLGEPAQMPRKKGVTFFRAAVVIAAVLVILILKPWQIEFRPTQEVVAQENRLAILYFENLADPDDSRRLGEVITDLLITDIAQSDYIQVVSEQRLDDMLSFMGRNKKEVTDKQLAMEIASATRAHWILTGKILQSEPNLVLTAQLLEIPSGNILESYRIDSGTDEDLFSLVDRLTVEIKGDLSLPKAALNEPDSPIADVTTHSPEAYLHYVEGVDEYTKLYFSDALASFEKALTYDSTFAQVYYYLSVLVDSGGQRLIDKAVKYSDKVNEKDRLYIKSRAASFAHNDSLAIGYLREIVEKYPEEKNALFHLGMYEYRSARIDDAIKFLERVVEVDPLNKAAYNQLAYAYDLVGNQEEALRMADRCIELAPDEANPYDTKGEILARNGRLEEAFEYYQKAVSIKRDFNDYSSLLSLGRLCIYSGNYTEALNYFQEVAARGERMSRSMARAYMAAIPLYQGKFEEALQITDDAIRADEMELATAGRRGARSYKHFMRGYIYLEKREYELAAREMAEAIRVHNTVFSSSRPAFRCTYAQVLAAGGNIEKAGEIESLLKKEYLAGEIPAKSAYWFTSGVIDMAQGNYKAATEKLEKAVAALPDYEFEIVLARAYLMDGDYTKAISEYSKLVNDYSALYRPLLGIEAVKSYYYLGLAYEKTGQPEKAADQYEKFLTIWKNADQGIEEMDDARERLSALRGRS